MDKSTRNRLLTSVSAIVDDGSGLADCWCDQGAGLSLLGITPGLETEEVLRRVARRFGRIVIREASFNAEDDQGGLRVLGKKAWEIIEVGREGSPSALPDDVVAQIQTALANAPLTIEHVWIVYLHVPGRSRGNVDDGSVDPTAAGEVGFGNGVRAGTRYATVGRTKVEVATWFAPKIKLLQMFRV